MVELKTKEIFIDKLLSTAVLTRREAYWLLTYLKEHPTILENVQFIEHADKTPRGLIFNQGSTPEDCFYLIKNKDKITNHEKIFHDIRLNWQKPLYIEVNRADTQNDELYYSVLEDNPFYTWNSQLKNNNNLDKLETFEELSAEQLATHLLNEINIALDNDDQETFFTLSKVYQEKIQKKNG